MNFDIKSGQEILDDFFSRLTDIEGLDKDVAAMIMKLYKEGKLTNINITNELETIRKIM